MTVLNCFFKYSQSSRLFFCYCKQIIYQFSQTRNYTKNSLVRLKLFQHSNAIGNSLILRFPRDVAISRSEKRFKHKKPKKEEDSDSELDDDHDVEDLKDGSKLITGYMTSLRADNVLKSGLGLARNKVETAFYESRIRINGKKIPKKSYMVNIGDEVDIIKTTNDLNEGLINISRVVVVSAKEDDEKIIVKFRRYRNLLIEKYEGA